MRLQSCLVNHMSLCLLFRKKGVFLGQSLKGASTCVGRNSVPTRGLFETCFHHSPILSNTKGLAKVRVLKFHTFENLSQLATLNIFKVSTSCKFCIFKYVKKYKRKEWKLQDDEWIYIICILYAEFYMLITSLLWYTNTYTVQISLEILKYTFYRCKLMIVPW